MPAHLHAQHNKDAGLRRRMKETCHGHESIAGRGLRWYTEDRTKVLFMRGTAYVRTIAQEGETAMEYPFLAANLVYDKQRAPRHEVARDRQNPLAFTGPAQSRRPWYRARYRRRPAVHG